ncbi:MAG: PAS domain S-box protein [Thermoplasmatales archaeon]|nr:PAS domain S-box protein [Thermoplasmatales archaeon]
MMRLRALLIIMCLAISMIPVAIIGGFQGFEIATAFLGFIIVVTFFVSLIMSYFISRPLEKLTKNINEISKGNLDVKMEKSEIFEINNLTTSLNRVMTSLKLAIHKVGVKKGEIFEETIKAKDEAEEKYENLLKNIDEWIWETDEKGVCKSCSANITNTLGYKPSEIIGKNIFEFLVPKESNKVKNIFKEMVRKKQHKASKFETQLVHKDGHNVCVLASFATIFDDLGDFRGFRGIGKDITEPKIAEEKIEDLDKKLSDMKERMRDVFNEREKFKYKPPMERAMDKLTEEEFNAMFIFDENANIIDCNKNMYEKLGYKKDEMLSLNLADFDYLETKEDIKDKIYKIKKQGKINLKTIHKKKNGSSIFVSESILYLKDKNMFKCIVKEDH